MVLPQTTRGRHWCFTLNNYTEDDIQRLSNLGTDIDYIIFAKEVGSVDGTPHLQGFVTFPRKLRFSSVRVLLSQRAHIELAKNVPASIQYCRKAETAASDIFEFGEAPVKKQGERVDINKFKEAVKGGLRKPSEIREAFSEVYAKYPRFCKEYVMDQFKIEIEYHPLRIWQAELNHMLLLEPDRRKVIFVVDFVGDTGKSWFCDYYCSIHDNAQILMPAKLADMIYVLEQHIRVLFLDCPRSLSAEVMEYVYGFIENVKNGRILNTKYESCMKRLNKLHVVVLMNETPNMSKLSQDRYHLINLDSSNNRYIE